MSLYRHHEALVKVTENKGHGTREGISQLGVSTWEQARPSIRKKMLRYIQIMIILFEPLKVVTKCCLNWTLFHGTLCSILNIEYQDETFKTHH